MKIIIIGAGEVGFNIASRLAMEHKDVAVIDHDPDAVKRVAGSLDVQAIVGSGSSPRVLEEAGLKKTDILLAVTDSDETNLVACLAADIISPSTKKVVRIRNEDFDSFHENFKKYAPHIDTIISPDIEIVKTVEMLLKYPGAVEVNEFAGGKIKFIGIRLGKNTAFAGVKLSGLPSLIKKRSFLIAAIVRDDELIIPGGEDKLMPDDLVYLISGEDTLAENLSAFEQNSMQTVSKVMIIGGGRIALRIASFLEETVSTKIIEKDRTRCLELAENLNKTVVLHGDGSDQELLAEENIRDMDVVITLTGDEETNILASLLAKKMGASKTITKIIRFTYFPLMPAIGLEHVISPRLSAINSILQHIRLGKVLSAATIKGEAAEVLEAEALETSDIVGKPLQEINMPKDALVVGIFRNSDVIIPSGKSVILPNDRIVIFTTREAIPAVEKILMVKLEYF